MKIINFFITLFILLNILILVGGSLVMADVLAEKQSLQAQKIIYKTKEQTSLERLNILKQSIIHVDEDIKIVTQDIDSLKETISQHVMNTQSVVNEKSQLSATIHSYQQKNVILTNKISQAKNTISRQASARVRTRTRSS